MSWFVYILRCDDGSLYTGVTKDLAQRLHRHNHGRGSAYVRSKGRGDMVYSEPHPDRSSAQKRECEIKSWSRWKKEALIGHHG